MPDIKNRYVLMLERARSQGLESNTPHIMLLATPAKYLEVRLTAGFMVGVVIAQHAWLFTTFLLWLCWTAHQPGQGGRGSEKEQYLVFLPYQQRRLG
jgi:hypothetical protein